VKEALELHSWLLAARASQENVKRKTEKGPNRVWLI